MKKLSKLALVGALTFGGFVGTSMVSPAEAEASQWDHNWGVTEEMQLSFITDWDGHGIGAWYHREELLSFVATGHTAKIYRIDSTGYMSVYKTLYGEMGQYGQSHFTTQLNYNYEPGRYVVVVKDGNSTYTDSHIFNIE